MVLSFRYLTHAYAMREGEMACEIEALAPKKCATWTGWLFNQCFNEHSLLNLWKELRKQDDVQTEDLDPETLKDIETAEKIITQFDEIDRKSQVFRYPVDRTGRVTVPPIQFDLVRLKEMLGWTSQFLDGWSTGVYEYRHAHP